MWKHAASRDVNGICTGFLNPFGYLNSIFECIAAPLPKRNCVMMINRTELGHKKEIGAQLFAYRLYDFQQEPGSVPQRPAILINPVVDGRTKKFGEQVTVARMQFNPVEACLAHSASSYRK